MITVSKDDDECLQQVNLRSCQKHRPHNAETGDGNGKRENLQTRADFIRVVNISGIIITIATIPQTETRNHRLLLVVVGVKGHHLALDILTTESQEHLVLVYLIRSQNHGIQRNIVEVVGKVDRIHRPVDV